MKSVPISEMVSAAKAGEEGAWKFLYNECHTFLYAHALRFCGNTPAAKDAVQETFLLAYLQLHQLKDAAALKGWLKKILVHICYRKQISYQRYMKSIPLKKDEWWENEIESKCELFYQQSKLFGVVAQLSEPLRCTLLLRYFSEFQSYEQIATILCLPVGTVRSRLNKAKSKIAGLWQDDIEADEKPYRCSKEWNAFYYHHFNGMYKSEGVKRTLIQHFDKNIEITFTSGKADAGRDYFEKEIENDLSFGTRYQPVNVISCDNISIVEGTNYNPPEYPNRCPSSSVLVLFRHKEKVCRMNLYNSAQ